MTPTENVFNLTPEQCTRDFFCVLTTILSSTGMMIAVGVTFYMVYKEMQNTEE